MPRKKRGSNWNTKKEKDLTGRIRDPSRYQKATVPAKISAKDVYGAVPGFTYAMMAAETTATKEVAAIAEPVLFDKFQNGDDEDDKSSDEESFHLPIDDEEAEKRDITLNGKGETEDDILDKFDSVDGTPDEDLEEDKLLDEAEDVVDKVNDVSEMNGTTNGDSDDKVSEIDKVDNEQNGDELGDKTLINEESKDKEEQNETEKTESQINGEDGGLEQEDVDMADIGEVKTEEIDIKDVDVNFEEALLNGGDEDEDVDLGKVKEDEELVDEKLEQDVKVEEEAINTADMDEEAANIEECLDTVDKENEQDQEETVNKDEGIVSQVEEPMNQDDEALNQDKEIVDKEGETVNNEDGGVEGTSKLMEDPPETFEDDEMMEDTPDLVENIQKLVDAPGLLEDDTANTKEDTANLEKETSKTNLEEETTNLDDIALRAEESITIMDDEEINKDSEEPVKDKSEENSNHSGKSNDQDTDDLLNVSIIRGVEEDDENAREELTKDKELQDAEDESCDKVSVSDSADNEPKDDSRMDFEDDDSKQTEDETTMVEKGDDTLTEKDDSSKIDDEESKGSESKDDDKHCDSGKENENPDDDDEDDDLDNDDGGDYEPESGDDSSKEGSIKSGKRSLSSAEDDVATKKRKLEDQSAAKVPDPPAEPVKEDPKILTSFATFMKDKKLKNKLTRADLEQFCLQKICESILHKTDVGELHQKLKNYESTIDSLRKDVSQLTKQARDLEIVNKKLMNELKLQNGNKKPMVPLKITRSVGLQVKLNVSVAENLRRRPGPPVQMPKQVQAAANANNRAPVRPNAPAARPMPQKTPILNQALQNRRTTQQTSTTPQKRPNFSTIRPKGASVIDLTDEDDRAKAKQTPKTVSLSPMKTVTVSQNKTINVGGNKTITVNQTKTIPLTQQKPGTPNRTMATGVRLTPTQLKNGSIAIPASVVGSSSPQLMYVVQPTSTLASGGLMSTGTGPQKAVLVNFQPTNGVLKQVVEGDIPKPGTSKQDTSKLDTCKADTSNSDNVDKDDISSVTNQNKNITRSRGVWNAKQKSIMLKHFKHHIKNKISPKKEETMEFKKQYLPLFASSLNGSSVSVIPKGGLQLKTMNTRKHPAPLPAPPVVRINADGPVKPVPPKPHLSIRKTENGIILQWKMPYNLDHYETIASYQLYAYQETNAPPSTDMWRRVGDVKALALPMACTLTQFADKNKYYFAVRSVDIYKRIGAFSDPEEISL